jgi:DinB superfamily
MRRSLLPFVAVALLSFALSRSSHAQQPPQPPTLASTVDRQISTIEKEVLDAAEAMPEEKFNFSPEDLKIPGSDYKGVRTFAVELKHIAASNYFLWSPITGDKLPEGLGDGNGSDSMKSKADILKFLKDSFALGHKAAATLTTENMLQPPGNSKSPRLYLATFGVSHAFDHYGQIAEYLRMNGIVPPASRPAPK